MNYRLLFLIAFLILGLGIVGLIMMNRDSAEQERATQEAVQQQQNNVEYDVVNITTAVAQKDIEKGQMLRDGDYEIVTQSIKVEKGKDHTQLPELSNDITNLTMPNDGSLNNAIAIKEIKKGQNLLASNLLIPGTQKYTAYQLKQSGLFSFDIPVKKINVALLNALEIGEPVSLFVITEKLNDKAGRLGKIVDFAKVINIVKVRKNQNKDQDQNQNKDQNQAQDAYGQDVIAVVSVSVNENGLRKLYELEPNITVLPLPKKFNNDDFTSGLFIRKMMGEGSRGGR